MTSENLMEIGRGVSTCGGLAVGQLEIRLIAQQINVTGADMAISMNETVEMSVTVRSSHQLQTIILSNRGRYLTTISLRS